MKNKIIILSPIVIVFLNLKEIKIILIVVQNVGVYIVVFDNLVAKCPNPSCYSDLKLIYQDLEMNQAKFRCTKRNCKVKEITMLITLRRKT